MDLALQIISNDNTVRSKRVQDLKDFNSESLATQAKKSEQVVSMMPANGSTFVLKGDDVVEVSAENHFLTN